ncbi:hypothetical protein JXM83_04010 [Candidatus Woesearchaeota archaeon]|nr:hypothetical protein [Candidatus Woesearchaeota archaeon]
MFTKIISLYEERKRKLSSVLTNRKDLKIENQHQIYGAVNEIDLFLKTLREYQSSQLPNTDMKSIAESMQSGLPDSSSEKLQTTPKESLFSKFFRR